MQDPTVGQPAANPTAEQQPQGATHSLPGPSQSKGGLPQAPSQPIQPVHPPVLGGDQPPLLGEQPPAGDLADFRKDLWAKLGLYLSVGVERSVPGPT